MGGRSTLHAQLTQVEDARALNLCPISRPDRDTTPTSIVVNKACCATMPRRSLVLREVRHSRTAYDVCGGSKLNQYPHDLIPGDAWSLGGMKTLSWDHQRNRIQSGNAIRKHHYNPFDYSDNGWPMRSEHYPRSNNRLRKSPDHQSGLANFKSSPIPNRTSSA